MHGGAFAPFNGSASGAMTHATFPVLTTHEAQGAAFGFNYATGAESSAWEVHSMQFSDATTSQSQALPFPSAQHMATASTFSTSTMASMPLSSTTTTAMTGLTHTSTSGH